MKRLLPAVLIGVLLVTLGCGNGEPVGPNVPPEVLPKPVPTTDPVPDPVKVKITLAVSENSFGSSLASTRKISSTTPCRS